MGFYKNTVSGLQSKKLEVEKILRELIIFPSGTNYIINDDLTIDVLRDTGGNKSCDIILCNNRGVFELPIQFGRVDGEFDASATDLMSTKGFPTSVGDSVRISDSMISKLDFDKYITNTWDI